MALPFDLRTTIPVLRDIAFDAVARIRRFMRDSGRNATGEASADIQVVTNFRQQKVTVVAGPRLVGLDEGHPVGVFPDRADINKWANARRIRFRDRRGRFIKNARRDYLIARKISRDPIPGLNFLEQIADDVRRDAPRRVAAAIARDAVTDLNQFIKNFNIARRR